MITVRGTVAPRAGGWACAPSRTAADATTRRFSGFLLLSHQGGPRSRPGHWIGPIYHKIDIINFPYSRESSMLSKGPADREIP